MSYVRACKRSLEKRENPELDDIGARVLKPKAKADVVKPKRKTKKQKRADRINKLHHPPNYVHYLNSKHWQHKRKETLKYYGGKCTDCEGVANLQVHHLNYDRLGRERMADLQVLCADCHASKHENKGFFDSLTKECFRILS